jgi:hypothetical protein
MSRIDELSPGDEVTLLVGDGAGKRVRVEAIERGGDYVTVFNPCPTPNCDCDPYMSVRRSSVRPVLQS